MWERDGPRAAARLWRHVDPVSASDCFGTAAADGRPARERLQELLAVVRTSGVSYRHELPFGPTDGRAQAIRSQTMVWREREATCLDIVLVAAALGVWAGLRVWVVLGDAGDGS